MWRILYYIGYLHAALANFDFFYEDAISNTFYQDDIGEIVKVTFPFTETMNQTSGKTSSIYSELTMTYNLSSKDFAARDNPIYIQMDDLFSWMVKFYNYYDLYQSAANKYKPLEIQAFDNEKIITIDANFGKQKFDNMQLFANIINITYAKHDKLQDVINNQEDLTLVITTLELLVTDFKHYVGVFYDTYQALSLAKQGSISELLGEQLLTSDKIIDLDKSKILQGGSLNNSVTFVIQVFQKKPINKFTPLIPISYFGYSLERDYFKLENSNIIDKFYIDDELNPENLMHIKQCLNGLNSKNYDKIFQHCKFIKTDKEYEVVSKGIIFNNGSNQAILQLNELFNKDLKYSDFPIVLHFNGSFALRDKAHKEFLVTKRYANLFQKSNLNVSTLTHLKETLFNTNENQILRLLEEELTGVIISIISFVILFSGLFVGNYFYKRIKSNQKTAKPQEKLILKKLRARKY